jgi:hypothetical protein
MEMITAFTLFGIMVVAWFALPTTRSSKLLEPTVLSTRSVSEPLAQTA